MRQLLRFFFYLILTIANLPLAFSEDAKDNSIKIGASLGLSGIAAPFGSGELKGIQLATEEWNSRGGINNRIIEIITEDTTSSNIGTITAIRKLINIDGVKYILGPTWLDSFSGVLPIVDKAGVLVFTGSGAPFVYKSSPIQYPFVFSTWYNLKQEVDFLLKHIHSNKIKNIIFIFDNDPFFQAIHKIALGSAEKLGLKVLAHHSTTLGERDFKSLLTKLKASDVEGIFFGFGDEGSLLSFLKQHKIYSADIPLFGTDYIDGYVGSPAFKGILEGARFVSPQITESTFAEKFKSKFGELPVLSASTAYDAANLLFEALSKGHMLPTEITKFLKSGKFNTVTFGEMHFDELGGVSTSKFRIKQVLNNAAVPVY